MMKTVPQVLAELDRKVTNTWAATLTGATEPSEPEESGEERTVWPLRLPLGKPAKAHLATNWPTVQTWAITWRDWATAHRLTLDWENRLTNGIRQTLPTHLTIPDLDTAAALLDGDWETRLARARRRLADLHAAFPHAATANMLTAVERLTETDYRLLLIAARWFTTHDATGLTPRQVPIEGLHGKWLNTHHRLIETLAAKPDLGLTQRRTRIHFTYLDPDHLASGGRLHDSHTLGDRSRPAYQPRLVVIAENKDTAVLFPALPGAISIEGNGFAGPALIPHLDWVHAADRIVYWGDIDAAGYDIVHRYRAAGLPVDTILMDAAAYTTYEPYGAWTDDKGVPLPCPATKPLDRLTDAERQVYTWLCDPTWTRVRRIEQERIPLAVAYQHLLDLTRTPIADPNLARLTGYLPEALTHMVEAATNADTTFTWPTTSLTPDEALERCVAETSEPGHGLLDFDTAAAVLLSLGVDPEEAAHCLLTYPAVRPRDEADLRAADEFLVLMRAGLTGPDAAAAHRCGLTPTETRQVLTSQGPGYLAAFVNAGYGEPELRAVLTEGTYPSLEDLAGFAALVSSTASRPQPTW